MFAAVVFVLEFLEAFGAGREDDGCSGILSGFLKRGVDALGECIEHLGMRGIGQGGEHFVGGTAGDEKKVLKRDLLCLLRPPREVQLTVGATNNKYCVRSRKSLHRDEGTFGRGGGGIVDDDQPLAFEDDFLAEFHAGEVSDRSLNVLPRYSSAVGGQCTGQEILEIMLSFFCNKISNGNDGSGSAMLLKYQHSGFSIEPIDILGKFGF